MRLTKVHSLIKVVFLGLVSLGFIACDNFITESQVKKEIEDAIAYANSSNITVTVSPLNNLQGQVTTGSVVIAKIGYPFTVNFVVDDAYTFGGWAAYSNFTSIADTPLSDEYIEFSDEDGKGPGKSLKCSVTIKKQIENIYIVPLCGSKPAVTLTEPLAAEKDVSITTPLKVTFNKKMDLSSILQKDEDGSVTGFKNFKVIYSKSNDDGESDSNGDITDYFDAPNTVLKKNGTQIVIPFKNKLDSTKWLPSASYITVELGANLSADTSEGGAVLDTTYTWTFVTGTTADVKGPAIKSAALALTNGTSEKTLESKNWNDWADFQNYRVAADYNSFKYSITADDSLTGDTGVLRYEVIQRLMYADKGAKLPNGTVLATATQFFNKNGEWNDVLGCSKNDFEVATEIEGNESGVENKVILLDELFTKYSTDGIYQITLTAVDALENYSDVPATFYFVRDTTSPCLSTNLNNISVNGGFVVSEGIVNGRYAKTGKEGITFVPKKTILDEGLFSERGNSLQTASKTVDWKISFSTSSTEDTHSIYSDYCNANSDTGLTLTISDLSTTQTYYPWFYFKDDLGNESAGECLLSQPVYVDVTAPVVNITCSSENVVLTEENNALTLYTDSSQKVSISVSDSMSGISAKTLTVDDVAVNWKNELTVNLDKAYAFTVTDNAGNSITKTLQVENKTAYGSPEIYNLVCYDTSEKNNDTKTIDYHYAPSAVSFNVSDSYNNDSKANFNIKGMTNGDVTFEFYAHSNLSNPESFFAENGILFENMTIKSYKIYSAVDNNGYYSYNDNDLLLDSENEAELTKFIPIKKNQLNGFVFCHVECDLETTKFIQSKAKSDVDKIISINDVDGDTLNNLAVTVFNSANSTTETYPMALDSVGPEYLDLISSSGIWKTDGKNEDGSYTVKVYRSPESSMMVCFARVNDDFNLRPYLAKLPGFDSDNGPSVFSCDNIRSNILYSVNYYWDWPENTIYSLKDALGNETEIRCEFYTDSEGPEINVSGVHFIRDGLDNYWTNSTEDVTVSFSDYAGFNKCEYSDGTNVYLYYPESSETSTLVLHGSETGTTYTLKAYDYFGNASEKTFVVGCDTTAPSCEVVNVVNYKKTLFKQGTDDNTTTCGMSLNGTELSRSGLIDEAGTLSVTSGMSTSVVGGINYVNNNYTQNNTQAVLFTLTENGSGIANIEILSDNQKINVAIEQKKYSNKTLAYANFFAHTGHSTTAAVSIRVTDMVGNTYTSPAKKVTFDQTGPSLTLTQGTSSSVKFLKADNVYTNVYTGSSSTPSASIKPTFSDGSGLNPNWTSSYYRTAVTLQISVSAKSSTNFTNGNNISLTGSSSGTVYTLYSQDTLGNLAEYKLKVYSTVAPDGAVTSLTLGD